MMSEKYKPVRASELYIKPRENGEVRSTTSPESQIDRIEKKLDRVLEHLEGKEIEERLLNLESGISEIKSYS